MCARTRAYTRVTVLQVISRQMHALSRALGEWRMSSSWAGICAPHDRDSIASQPTLSNKQEEEAEQDAQHQTQTGSHASLDDLLHTVLIRHGFRGLTLQAQESSPVATAQ